MVDDHLPALRAAIAAFNREAREAAIDALPFEVRLARPARPGRATSVEIHRSAPPQRGARTAAALAELCHEQVALICAAEEINRCLGLLAVAGRAMAIRLDERSEAGCAIPELGLADEEE